MPVKIIIDEHKQKMLKSLDLLKSELKKDPKRKIIAFTEYADTAEYVYDMLKDDFKIFRYTSRYATEANKKTIKENFDAGAVKKSNDYNILIATDAISEGYNLNRAGTVFNYDIPYNPTRVIQRVGRINRINKKVFDELYIYNFFPTAAGEEQVRIKQITTLKIMMINHIMGEDTRVLTSEEELISFYREQISSSISAQEQKSWDVDYINLLNSIKSGRKEIIKQALSIPLRTRIRREINKDKKGVIVFGKKGDDYTFKLGMDGNNIRTLTAEEGIKLFEADMYENPFAVSGDFEDIYQNLKKNLFVKKAEFKKDKGLNDAIDKIKYLVPNYPEIKNYLEDLLYTMEKLNSIPERFLKLIRAINNKNIKKDLADLQKMVPHSYLAAIINKANKIQKGEEYLILSEELA